MAGKLHEILAVEGDMRNLTTKILNETKGTFTNKKNHFIETSKSFEAQTEEDKYLEGDPVTTPMVTTVRQKLDYTERKISPAIDCFLQKERTNCLAKADWNVKSPDGTTRTILKDVPVTFLVQMERFLVELREKVYGSVPTFDPMKKWELDDSRTDGVYRMEPKRVVRTKQVTEPIVVIQPTTEHPGQHEMISKHVFIGYNIENMATGELSPKQKSDLLDRVDRLIAGVKVARARANTEEVEDAHVADEIFGFINAAL